MFVGVRRKVERHVLAGASPPREGHSDRHSRRKGCNKMMPSGGMLSYYDRRIYCVPVVSGCFRRECVESTREGQNNLGGIPEKGIPVLLRFIQNSTPSVWHLSSVLSSGPKRWARISCKYSSTFLCGNFRSSATQGEKIHTDSYITRLPDSRRAS